MNWIEIDGYVIELPEAKLTIRGNDLSEIGTIADSSYTTSVRVNSSKEVRQIFGRIDLIQDQTDSPYRRFECKFYMNDILISSNAYVVVWKFEDDQIELSVVAGIVDFISRIEDLNLRDLDFSSLNHPYSISQVAALSQGFASDGNAQLRYSFAMFSEDTLFEFSGSEYRIDANKQIFAINVRGFIEKICTNAGFTLNASNAAWSSDYQGYIPLGLEEPYKFAEKENTRSLDSPVQLDAIVYTRFATGSPSRYYYFLSQVTTADADFSNDKQSFPQGLTDILDFRIDPTVFGHNGSIYNYPQSGSHVFRFTIEENIIHTITCEIEKIDPTTYDAGFEICVGGFGQKFASDHGQILSSDTIGTKITLTATAEKMYTGSFPLMRNQIGSYLIFSANTGLADAATFEGQFDAYRINSWTYKSEFQDPPPYLMLDEETMYVNDHLPDINQKDFFSLMCKYYGWYPVLDGVSKTLFLYDYSDITNKSRSEDWSDKFVRLASIEYQLDGYGQRNIVRYEKQDDNTLDRDKVTEFLVDNIQLEKESDFYNLPITYKEHRNVLNKSYLRHSLEWNIAILKLYSTLSEPLRNIDSIGGQSFSTSNQRRWEGSDTIQEVLDRISIIEDINNKAKKVEAYFELTRNDIINLDFTKCKYVKQLGAYFYLNEVKEWSGQSVVLCEIIRI